MSSKPFRESMLFPVVFTLLITVLFVGILAVMYRSSEAKIEAHKRESYQKIVVSLVAQQIASRTRMATETLNDKFKDTYSTYIKDVKLHDLDRNLYSAVVNDSIVAYCAEIYGKGLWGSMRALVSFSPDFQKQLGMDVYEHMETPGLGARIEEDWFLKQFENLQVIKDKPVAGDYVLDFEFVPEGKSVESSTQIQQVTGATITSQSVIRMLRTEINLIYSSYLKQVSP